MKQRLYAGFWLTLLAMMLSGCVSRPVPQTPLADQSLMPERWQQPFVTGSTYQSLFDLVEDPQLEALVRLAMQQNAGLQQLALQLQEAGLLVEQQRAAKRPQVNAKLESARQNSPSDSGLKIANNYSLGLNVSWELDVWRRLADAEAAAQYDEAALLADYQAARNSLAGEVLRKAIMIVYLQNEVVIEQQRLANLTLNEKFIKDRYQAGLGNLADLEAARSAAERTAAEIASKQQLLAESERRLAQLMGDPLLKKRSLPETLPQVSLTLAEMPAAIMTRRPDLQAALQRIQAADSQANVAYKNLLPSFSLAASWSKASNRPSRLLSSDPLWSLLGNLSAPLFQGGALRAQAESAQFSAERALWAYRERLLAATVEVEDKLGQEHSLAQQKRHLAQALKHATTTHDYYRQRYRQGLSTIFDLLIAQQNAFNLEIELLQNRFQRLTNRIDLALALGLGESSAAGDPQ